MRKPTQKPQNANLADLVDGKKVFTSSELIGLLGKRGLSGDNARQIIRRGAKADGVWRSEKLRLPNNERLFAASSTLTTPAFLAAVAQKLASTRRKGLARCLAALSTRHVLHKIEVMRLLAVSPSLQSNASLKRLYESELDGLKELGVRSIHKGTVLESIVSPAIPDVEGADEIATLAAERLRNAAVLARVLIERLRRQNLLSWNQIEMGPLESPYATFNGQVFSAYGFSYLAPLARWKEGRTTPTPCPTLVDAYDDSCSLAEVQSFIQRIQRATIRGKSRMAALGIIAARDFSPDAWEYARQQGLITINFRQLFGDEALEAMVLVEKLLYGLKGDSNEESADRFKSFAELIKDLKTNPVVVTLRSVGFEALSGLILRSKGFEHVELGRVVSWQDTSRDIDVFGIRDDELRVIECKAYHRHKSLLEEDVRKFFTETLPALKSWLRATDRHFTTCKAEIWTTGPLGNAARNALYELQAPASDEWKLVRAEGLKPQIPKAIRDRSMELFRTIAISESVPSEDESMSG